MTVSALDNLTARERQVLDGIIACKFSREIAHDLGVTEKTVRLHRSSILAKTGAKNVVHLVRMALNV